ncbi:MAG: tetratricopeptide repeat protein [Candidatus Riflebacteria bacterium]|nr:tetratricopeptide repeat protein [Candidatus Riflebacteria bacterium]
MKWFEAKKLNLIQVYCVILMLFGCCSICHAKPADAANPYLQAIEAFAHNDFASGVKKYYQFVSFSEIILSKQIRISDLEKARQFFTNAALSPEKKEKADLFLALIDRITENWEGAHERIDFLRQSHPRSLVLSYAKGELHLAQHQIKEAQQYLDWIIKAAPDSPFATITRALLSLYEGSENVDAEKRKSVLMAAGYRNWDLLEIDQAIRFFEIVTKDFPSEKEAFKSLVFIYLDLENYNKAREINDSWKKNNKKPLLDPMTQVRLLLANEEYDEATVILNDLVSRDSSNEQAKLMLADCLFSLDKLEPALLLYQEIFPENPGNIGIIQRIKHCMESLGKIDEAVKLFKHLADIEPDNPMIQLDLAELYMLNNDLDQSEVYYDLLSSYDNPYSDYAAEMSAKIAQYRQEKAIAELEEAARLTEANQRQHNSGDSSGSSTSLQVSVSEDAKEIQIDELKKLMAIYE